LVGSQLRVRLFSRKAQKCFSIFGSAEKRNFSCESLKPKKAFWLVICTENLQFSGMPKSLAFCALEKADDLRGLFLFWRWTCKKKNACERTETKFPACTKLSVSASRKVKTFRGEPKTLCVFVPKKNMKKASGIRNKKMRKSQRTHHKAFFLS